MRWIYLIFLLASPVTLGSVSVKKTTISEHLSSPHRSVEGAEIPLVIIKNGQKDTSKSSLRFFVQGGLHGNETMTTQFVFWMIDDLTKNGLSALGANHGIEIHFIPSANPDSYSIGRYNKNFVNLNRNFSVLWGLTSEPPGKKPFSEPETEAIKALFDKHSYTAAIDVHGYVNWIVAPSAPSQVAKNVDPRKVNRYKQWIRTVKTRMREGLPGYQLKTAGGLGDGGSFEDWTFWKKNAFSVCLEMFSKKRFLVENSKVIDTFPKYRDYILKLFRDAIVIDGKLNKKDLANNESFLDNQPNPNFFK